MRSVARGLPAFLWLGLAASEGGAVSDLFSFLLRWRGARGVGAVTGGVHPPAGVKGTFFLAWGVGV